MMLADAGDVTKFFPPRSPGAAVLPTAGDHAPSVVARNIVEEDLPEVANLLHEGFPSKSPAQFAAALELLSRQRTLPGLPRYGYVLASKSGIVGALLTMNSEIADGATKYLRCNVGCWYVRPSYRLYAPLLVLRSNRQRTVTHLNVWPARHTWNTIKAQGFKPVCNGTFIGVPLLSASGRTAKAITVGKGAPVPQALPDWEVRILEDHADFGCLTFLCRNGSNLVPFIVRQRKFRRIPVPCAQLIYCRSLDDLGRCAASIGRYLAANGMPWLLAGASQPIKGIPGVFLRDKMPIYFKGQIEPREGDLTYTETAMFGF